MKSLILTLLILPLSAIAADGPGSGNGGNLVRIDIESVINQVRTNCSKWNSIRFMEADGKKVCERIGEKIAEVGFTKEKLKISPTIPHDRTGENFPNIPAVTFSEKKWTANKDNTIAKIGIVLHEYLGLLGLEKTDDYHISHAVMNELQSVSLISSDNPNFMKTMAKADADLKKAKSCKVKMSDENRSLLINAAMEDLQAAYKHPGLTKDEKKALSAKYDEVYHTLIDFNVLRSPFGTYSICNRPKEVRQAEPQSDEPIWEDATGNAPAN